MSGVGDNLALVSPDDIREEIYPGYSAGLVPFIDIDNDEIFPRAFARMERHIIEGWDIWFDAINISDHARSDVFVHAEYAKMDPEFSGGELHYVLIVLDIPLEEIKTRNESARVGHRRPPEGTLATMWSIRNEDSVILPADHLETWRLMWDGEWKMADGFEPPTICVDLVDSVNREFSGRRTRRAP
jgi:hypothetical protein